MSLNSIPEIIAELKAGRMAVLVDDEDRENEGDLIFAAEFVTAEKINFMAKFGRGLVCMPITEAHAERLNLLPMVARNRSVHGTNFTVSIEAASGVTTGISAADRARTIKVAASPKATPADIVQPGHVFPLIAQAGGVLVRAGHTEACCDLAQLAGLHPAAVLCEIMKDDGTMARLDCAQSPAQLIERVASPERPEGPLRMDFLTYGIGAQILRDLKVGKMRLMASPRKMPSMAGWELEVTGYAEKAAKTRGS